MHTIFPCFILLRYSYLALGTDCSNCWSVPKLHQQSSKEWARGIMGNTLGLIFPTYIISGVLTFCGHPYFQQFLDRALPNFSDIGQTRTVFFFLKLAPLVKTSIRWWHDDWDVIRLWLWPDCECDNECLRSLSDFKFNFISAWHLCKWKMKNCRLAKYRVIQKVSRF